LVARYRLEGEAAFQPRSRRPHSRPAWLPQATIDLIIGLRRELSGKGLDNGPHTIAWHLQFHHGLVVSAPSIRRHLAATGLIAPTPQRRPKSSFIRFAAEQPNERWQAGFTHWWLAEGTHVEILNWLDDHARYALSVTAPPRHHHYRATDPTRHLRRDLQPPPPPPRTTSPRHPSNRLRRTPQSRPRATPRHP
jgi:hypothetical protein